MRICNAGPLVVALLLIGRPGSAQPARPFADLARYLPPEDAIVSISSEADEVPASLSSAASRVKPGERVSVRVTTGEEIEGLFARASTTSLTLVVNGQPREIPADVVQQLTIERGRNRVWLGVLIGAPLGAFLGSANCYHVDTSPQPPGGETHSSPCAASVAAGAAIGAGLGGAIGHHSWRPAAVYSRPPGVATAGTRVPGELPVPAPAAPANQPVTSLGSLASRVLPFETIYVRTADRKEIEGQFSHSSDESLTMDVGGGIRVLSATDVEQVRRRGKGQVRKGMLIGFIVGAVALSAPFAAAYGPEAILITTPVGGGVGLLFGAMIGASFHERPLVYRATAPSVRIMPLITPHGGGVNAAVGF